MSVKFEICKLRGKEKVCIMKCSAFLRTGNYHRKNAISCQDYYTIIENDDLSILVICDGAGDKKAGALAAKVVSDLVAKYLYENFNKLYFIDSSDAKRRIAQHIDNCLEEYSMIEGISGRELACTIMAIAVDKEQRCICLHLGDGIVLHYKCNQDILKVISFPMNGLTTNLTFVTMNCELTQYMQFYRWQEMCKGTFLMMTDGAQEHVQLNKEFFQNNVTVSCSVDLGKLRHFLDNCMPMDDYSCGIICYNDLE